MQVPKSVLIGVGLMAAAVWLYFVAAEFSTFSYYDNEMPFVVSLGTVVAAASGLVLVVRSVIAGIRRRSLPGETLADAETVVSSSKRFLGERFQEQEAVLPPRRVLSIWVLTTSAVLMVLMFVFMIFYGPEPSYGLWIYTKPPFIAPSQMMESNRRVVVRVTESHEEIPNCFINDLRIHCSELRGVLQQEFSRRADWLVYLEGDHDLTIDQVAQVISSIHHAGGKVVLLPEAITGSLLPQGDK